VVWVAIFEASFRDVSIASLEAKMISWIIRPKAGVSLFSEPVLAGSSMIKLERQESS